MTRQRSRVDWNSLKNKSKGQSQVETDEIFLELITVSKWSHFLKEIIIVDSISAFRWKLNVYENVVFRKFFHSLTH